jgi:hypothetical protein
MSPKPDNSDDGNAGRPATLVPRGGNRFQVEFETKEHTAQFFTLTIGLNL